MPFKIIRDDITRVAADAVVNTANPQVAIGDGVDSAIYAAAGEKELLAARKKIGELKVGEVGITPAFRLSAKYIIHSSGPVWRGGKYGEAELLRQCYDKCLKLAAERDCQSIAFPLMATGAYRFPKELGMQIAIDAFEAFLEENEMEITLVVFEELAYKVSGQLYVQLASFIDERVPEVLHQEERVWGRRIWEDAGIDSLEAELAPEDAETDFLETDLIDDETFLADECEWSESDDEVTLDAQQPTGEPCDAQRTAVRGIFEEERSLHVRTLAQSAGQARMDLEPPRKKEKEKPRFAAFRRRDKVQMQTPQAVPMETAISLEERLKQMYTDSFEKHLQQLINKKGMKNSEVYAAANISKQYFSKLMKGNVKPSKEKVLSLAVGLRLNMDEATDLLKVAGYALSPVSQTDVIVEYFIQNKDYSVMKIDIVLFDYGLPSLSE